MECFTVLLALGALTLAILAWTRVKSIEARHQHETEINRRRFDLLARVAGELEALKGSAPMAEPSSAATATPPPVEAPRPVPMAPPPAEPQPRPVVAPPPQPSPPQPSPPPPSPPPPSPPPAPRPAPRPAFDWEGLVGVRLFSWIAGIALALGAVFFLRYSIEHGWLGPAVRMALGALTGVGLLILCELKVARRYAVTAHALDAAGIAILFATFYAAHALWALIGAPLAFAALALIAALAVALSLRRDSLFIALLGLVGGFATPILLAPTTDRPVALFGYLLLLNAGLAWVALERGWPALSVASLALTVGYQWRWTAAELAADNLALGMAIFLAFPVLWLLAPRLAGRSKEDASPFARMATAGACVPLVFAVYLATSSAYGERFWLFFGFLFALAVGFGAIAAVRGPGWLHAAAAASVVVGFLGWASGPSRAAAWPWTLLVLAAFVLFYLAARSLASWLGRPLGEAGPIASWAAPLLFFVFPLVAAAEGAGEPWLWSGVAFALAAAVAAFGWRRGDAWQLLLAAGLGLLAETVWAADHLSAATLQGGLLRQVVWGLFLLAVALWAERRGRPLTPGGAVYGGLAPFVLLLSLPIAWPELCLPPLPLLAAGAALTVCLLAGALLAGRGGLAVATVVAASFVLLLWLLAVPDVAPWPRVAVWTALALAALGFGTFFLAQQHRERFGAAAILGFLLAQPILLVAGAAETGAAPGLWLYAGVGLLLLAAFFAAVERLGRGALALLAVVTSFAAVSVWPLGDADWTSTVVLAGLFLAAHLAYPLALGERARRRLVPVLSAVLASFGLFLPALASWFDGGPDRWRGLLPLAFAAALAPLLAQQQRGRPEAPRKVTLVASAILAFLSVAVPLQLDREWITLGWAVLAAALAWLSTRVDEPALRFWIFGLGTAAFVRLALNPAVLAYHPRSGPPIWNWYLYTYLVPVVAFLLAAYWLKGGKADQLGAGLRLSTLLKSAAGILLFLLLNIEIADSFSLGETLTFGFLTGRATLAEDLTYTLGWAVFALALLGVGIASRSRPVRLAALLLLSAAVLKGFLHDMGRLGGLYRVASFVGLAFALAAVAVLIQRFVLRQREPPAG